MIKGQGNIAAQKLRAGGKVSAAWLQAASPISAEIMAEAGFDVLIVDLEHSPGDPITLITLIQAMKGEKTIPFARAHWNDFVEIKKLLDAGLYGLIIPYVSTAGEAKEAVRACKYPPVGIRGLASSTRASHYGNNSRAYFDSANDEIFIFLQIETPDGVKNIDEILAVDGVDGIFIGPNDLATTHGYLASPEAPEIQAIIREIEKKIIASGKAMATICSGFDDAKAKYERGYNMIMIMSDTTTLSQVARECVSRFENEVC